LGQHCLTVFLIGVIGDLKTYIADQGGAFTSKVTDDCTHLVANQKQFDAKGAKGESKLLLP
jgi:twin BRCT domain